ncbi:MAG: hypothetical protein GC131_05920 [Alphaproteobacteria bacterium]|nr:hypothetical protein [Alphaproteobacteria bacterium]
MTTPAPVKHTADYQTAADRGIRGMYGIAATVMGVGASFAAYFGMGTAAVTASSASTAAMFGAAAFPAFLPFVAPALLGVVGLGLLAFGIYNIVKAMSPNKNVKKSVGKDEQITNKYAETEFKEKKFGSLDYFTSTPQGRLVLFGSIFVAGLALGLTMGAFGLAAPLAVNWLMGIGGIGALVAGLIPLRVNRITNLRRQNGNRASLGTPRPNLHLRAKLSDYFLVLYSVDRALLMPRLQNRDHFIQVFSARLQKHKKVEQ